MDVKTPTVSNVADVFLTLPREEQEEIFHIGATFRLLDLRKRLSNFPHHKHVERRENRQPSFETCLEDVMEVILPKLAL